MIIENGVGNGNTMLVDRNNQAHTFSITETEAGDALIKGNAYNINTGDIPLTTASPSAVLYFKNDEAPVNGETSIFIEAIAVGIKDDGTTGAMSTIKLIRNPTAGTIVTGATAIDMNANRNGGSSQALDSLIYKGAEGNTFTDGADAAQFYQSAGSRGYYPINWLLTKGSSIGITIDTETSAGTTNIYVAVICHRVDGNNKKA